MLLSMTGYGRASGSFGGKTISVEIRALNSKLTDLKLRLPADYKEKELEFRKLVTDHAERGKPAGAATDHQHVDERRRQQQRHARH